MTLSSTELSVTHRRLLRGIVKIALAAGLATSFEVAHADEPLDARTVAQASTWRCGGPAHERLRKSSLDSLVAWIGKQLSTRLHDYGDTYALYDVQMLAQSHVDAFRRCKDHDSLRRISEAAGAALASLTETKDGHKVWVCSGGTVCNANRALLGHEVLLNSLQFLGFLLATESNPNGSGENENVATGGGQAVTVALDHLTRLADGPLRKRIVESGGKRPVDAADGSTRYLFSDLYLWIMVIWFELDGQVSADSRLRQGADWARARDLAEQAGRLFTQRLTIDKTRRIVDLDRGFWADYWDNSFARYDQRTPPLVCRRDDQGRVDTSKPGEWQVKPSVKYRDSDSGWDVSHMRRLVVLIESALAHPALRVSPPRKDISWQGLRALASDHIVRHIWNQDLDRPLFSNYWNGATGWYRIGYEGAGEACREGYPPGGLSSQFVLGGYLAWRSESTKLNQIAIHLIKLGFSQSDADRAFVKQNYSYFTGAAAPTLAAYSVFAQFVGTAVK